MKSNSLSNIDITNILRAQGIEINGIFMKDELPKKLKKGFYVINLASNTDNNGGTHWTAFYHGSDNYYFDAFGFIAPMEVDKRLKSYVYNTSQIQDINSTACGFYCIGFIIYMNSQKNKMEGYKSFVNLFSSDTKENDKKLYAILYK